MNTQLKNMPIEASNRDMDIDMLGIKSRTIGGEIPKKLEKMLIQRSTVKRKKDLGRSSGAKCVSYMDWSLW